MNFGSKVEIPKAMSAPVLVVDNLCKHFDLGRPAKSRSSLRDMITDICRKPLAAFKKRREEERFWALQNVSFELQQGEVLGIVGYNGAGKSTLLKVLSKITRPSSGKAVVRGRLGSLLEVGTGFHGDLTGRENILLNGAILGMSRRDTLRHFDSIVSFAEIEKFLDTPVKFYSSGMYIRLAFAVAAHLDPDILIVDEVLAVGDMRFQKKCLERMEKIASSGQTILFVSHNLAAVRNFCTKALYLKQGEVAAFGAVAEVIDSYTQQSSVGCKEKCWPVAMRPGNDNFKINRLRLRDAQVQLSKEIVIEIDYTVLKDHVTAAFALALYDEDDRCVFTTFSHLEPQHYGKALCKGSYLTSCVIPPHLLNAKTYYVTVSGFSNYHSDLFSLEKVLFFEAVDDGYFDGEYVSQLKGAVRPQIPWHTLYHLEPESGQFQGDS